MTKIFTEGNEVNEVGGICLSSFPLLPSVQNLNSPRPNFYDAANAATLVQFAAAAYTDGRATLRGAVTGSNQGSTESHPTVIECPVTDTRVVITTLPDDIIVAFRGTGDLRNWLTDLDVAFVTQDGCRVHAGFSRALQNIQSKLAAIIFAPHEPPRRIWLTGHSLGGALARQFAWRMVNHLRSQPFAALYTFGEPRGGDAAFRDSWPFKAGLNSCSYRVVNALDIVPHIPWLCGRYRHCAHEVFYDVASGVPPDGSGRRPDPTMDRSALTYALGDVLAMVSEFLNPTSCEQWLADHHISRYAEMLRRKAKG